MKRSIIIRINVTAVIELARKLHLFKAAIILNIHSLSTTDIVTLSKVLMNHYNCLFQTQFNNIPSGLDNVTTYIGKILIVDQVFER